jgi:hypothetical protein
MLGGRRPTSLGETCIHSATLILRQTTSVPQSAVSGALAAQGRDAEADRRAADPAQSGSLVSVGPGSRRGTRGGVRSVCPKEPCCIGAAMEAFAAYQSRRSVVPSGIATSD